MKNFLILGFANSIAALTPLLCIFVPANFISSEEFNSLNFYYSISLLILILIDFQASSFFLRRFYECKSEDDREKLKSRVASLGIIFSFVVFFFGFLGSVFYKYSIYYLFFIIIFSFSKFIYVIKTIELRLKGEMLKFLFHVLVFALFSLSLSFFFSYLMKSAHSVFLGLALGGVGYLLFNIRWYDYISRIRIYLDFNILKFSFPLVLVVGSTWCVYNYIFLWAPMIIDDQEELAAFNASVRMASVFLVLANTIKMVFDPYIQKSMADLSEGLSSKAVLDKKILLLLLINCIMGFLFYLILLLSEKIDAFYYLFSIEVNALILLYAILSYVLVTSGTFLMVKNSLHYQTTKNLIAPIFSFAVILYYSLNLSNLDSTELIHTYTFSALAFMLGSMLSLVFFRKR